MGAAGGAAGGGAGSAEMLSPGAARKGRARRAGSSCSSSSPVAGLLGAQVAVSVSASSTPSRRVFSLLVAIF